MTTITTSAGESVRVQNYGDFLHDPFGDRFFDLDGTEYDPKQRSYERSYALGKWLAEERERALLDAFAK